MLMLATTVLLTPENIIRKITSSERGNKVAHMLHCYPSLKLKRILYDGGGVKKDTRQAVWRDCKSLEPTYLGMYTIYPRSLCTNSKGFGGEQNGQFSSYSLWWQIGKLNAVRHIPCSVIRLMTLLRNRVRAFPKNTLLCTKIILLRH